MGTLILITFIAVWIWILRRCLRSKTHAYNLVGILLCIGTVCVLGFLALLWMATGGLVAAVGAL